MWKDLTRQVRCLITWYPVLAKRRVSGALARVLAAAAVLSAGLLGANLGASPAARASGIRADRSKVAELEQTIEAEGERVQALVTRTDSVQGHLLAVERQISHQKAILAGDRRSEAKAVVRLRQVAIDSYISDTSGATAPLLNSGNSNSVPEAEVYQGVASDNLDSALAALALARHHTATSEGALRADETRSLATLRQLATDRRAAQRAIATDESELAHVKGSLVKAIVAANYAHEEKEEEEAAAAAAAARQKQQQQQQQNPTPSPTRSPSPTPSPSPPAPVSPSPGSYSNPLRSISDLEPERIDQGVDYSGTGPIYAIGDGVVLSTVNGGWPGGTFIAYRLSAGPAAGLTVYAAEDIDPSVQVGETVTANTVLGQMYEGPDGIETGWADGSALGLTMAAEYGQFNGSNSTAFGYNFSQLLESTGAPGGILQNDPPTGTLPSGWPQW